jgi:hypothetical protein
MFFRAPSLLPGVTLVTRGNYVAEAVTTAIHLRYNVIQFTRTLTYVPKTIEALASLTPQQGRQILSTLKEIYGLNINRIFRGRVLR